jgi:hypothetical protein
MRSILDDVLYREALLLNGKTRVNNSRQTHDDLKHKPSR